MVLPKFKTVIFVNGCFWHQHPGCKNATIPKTRTEFWVQKLNKNISNDNRNQDLLREMGWTVIVVWECELEKDFEGVMKSIVTKLDSEKKERNGG